MDWDEHFKMEIELHEQDSEKKNTDSNYPRRNIERNEQHVSKM